MTIAGNRTPNRTRTAAAPATTPPAAGPTDDRAHWGMLIVLMAGVFMTALDVFIVNIAIPATAHDLRAGPDAIQWIVAGFSLAVAAGVITAGRLGDLYGRRRMYALGLGLFTLASGLCGLAPDTGILIAGRVAQGLAAALMSPQALAILGTAFAGRARARAFSVYGLTMGVAAVFGQLIGGALIEADPFGLSWRSCFLVNLPVGVLALVLLPRLVPESRGTGRARLDIVGMILVTVALVATVLPLIQGQASGWPVWTWLGFVAAAVLFACFAGYQIRLGHRGGAPLIDPDLFRARAFPAGLVAQVVFWMGEASFFLVFALYLQQGRGLGPLRAGLVFTVIGAGYLVTSTTAHRIEARLGRLTVPAGTLLMAAGLALLWAGVARAGDTGSVTALAPGLLVDGLGMGMALSPLVSTVLATVPPRHAGAASGALSTAMQVGGALGVSVVGVIFYRALPGPCGYPHAFQASLAFLIAVAVGTAALVALLPGDRARIAS
jgi:EmrB/QacA subfamily drug resistance transporter